MTGVKKQASNPVAVAPIGKSELGLIPYIFLLQSSSSSSQPASYVQTEIKMSLDTNDFELESLLYL